MAIPSLVLLDLTLRGVLANVPHDTGALIVLFLVGSLVALTVLGNRQSTIDRFNRDKNSNQAESKSPGQSTGTVGKTD